MRTLARSPARSLEPGRREPAHPIAPTGWLLEALFGLLLVWWASGLQGFIAVFLAVPLLGVVVMRGWSKVPAGFWLYLLFLLWVPVTLARSESVTSLMVAGWRYSIYLASGVLFVYVYNAPKHYLPTPRVIRILAAFWVITAVGGLMGTLLPRLEFTSPVELLIRDFARADPLLRLMVHPSTALARSFEALPLHRPNAPFPDPNQWGANFALSLPFALAALAVVRTRARRTALWALLVVSLIPLVVSLNRGAWLACLVAVSYAALRLATTRNLKALAALLLSCALVAGVLFATTLGEFVRVRLGTAPGDDRRLLLYESSLTLAGRSPVLGWGGPVELTVLVPGAPPNPPIGTHGQLWLVMVSHGVVPGLVLFVGWLAWAFVATGRRGRASSVRSRAGPGRTDPDSNARFWCHIAILVAIVELPYYELIPWGLPVVMVAAALGLREQRADLLAEGEAVPSTPPGWTR